MKKSNILTVMIETGAQRSTVLLQGIAIQQHLEPFDTLIE